MSSTEARLQQAVGALQAGRIGEAETLCRQVRASDPRDVRAVNLLSAIARQAGRLDEAEALLRQGLETAPSDPQLLNNLGSLLEVKGQPEAALPHFEGALAVAPDYAQAHNNQGVALERLGRLTEACASYRHAARLEPRAAQYHCNLANALRAEGALAEAEAAYRDALRDPRFLPPVLNLAALMQGAGRGDEALALYRQAQAHHPHSAELAGALGTLLLETGNPAAAVTAFRQALSLQNPEAAAGVCATYRNLGLALYRLGRAAEAAEHLEQALALDPDDLGALITRGQIALGSHDIETALGHLEKALVLSPDHPSALISLLKLYQRLCRWADFDRLVPRLDARAAAAAGGENGFVEPPLFHITRIDDLARNLDNARRTSAAIEQRARADGALPAASPRPRPDSSLNGRLRLGYLSRDYRNHPVGHLIHGLFAAHDRADFEVFAYSYGPDDDSPYRRGAERDSDRFVDLAGLSNGAAAARIQADGVDILVDLAGHTNLNRLEICALRPAPVQATYLGFPGGSGAAFFDYLIGDPIVTPPLEAGFYREALALLPHAYQINDGNQTIADQPADRTAAGLPDDALVLACFNQPFKFDAALFALWCEILKELPGALLWLFDETGGLLAQRLQAEAADRGLDPARLHFAPRLPKSQHLARLALADLMLDTRLYNGHTTTSDALWAGLPVVTMKGRHFASRVSASLLTAVGLPKLIVDSPTAYRDLVLLLARDPDRLAGLREKLRTNRRTEPLFDTTLTTRHLEAAYRAMWDLHRTGQAPRLIQVEDRTQAR